MKTRTIHSIVEEKLKSSTEFWAGKPKMTMEELEAVEEFAKGKNRIFEKTFSSIAKVEKAKNLRIKALGL